jgi:hypothetical protein
VPIAVYKLAIEKEKEKAAKQKSVMLYDLLLDISIYVDLSSKEYYQLRARTRRDDASEIGVEVMPVWAGGCARSAERAELDAAVVSLV